MTAKAKKTFSPKAQRALAFWHGVTATSLKEMPIDLSVRQAAILLNVHLLPGPHSIKNLSEALHISKPAICRALDVLEAEKLLRRSPDRNDKRNIHVLPTVKGNALLSQFADIIAGAQKRAA